MVTIPGWIVRYGFPALALAAVTLAVLLLRPPGGDGDAVRAQRAARPAEAPQRRPRRTQARSARVSAYSIRSGDTLGSIADRFGTTVERLVELNPGIDPRALRVGQPIRVD
jgi:Tfp pilus assembly protein FimV